MKKSCILYLVPDLFGPPGGIARHGRSVCHALMNLGYGLSTIALLDKSGAQTQVPADFAAMRYTPCNEDRKLFIRQALRAMKQRPSLVLVEHLNFSPLGWLVARLLRVPLVVVAHGIDAWEPLPPTRRKAMQRAERVLCVSRFTADRLQEINGVRSQRIRVLHNCLEPASVSRELPNPEHPSHPSLLTVARMSTSENYKGHDYVIRALPILLQRFPNLIYDVVGKGDGQAALQGLASELGVADRVRFHGGVSEEELAQFYISASIFVMPSRGEGFGIAFLEAMVQGVPVIGGNMDASPEVIHHNEAGLVVNPTSVEEIAGAISEILSDDALRRRMGQRGRELALGKFGFENFQETLGQYLQEVLDERDKR